MKSQVLHTVCCNTSGEAAREILSWSLLGVKGLVIGGPEQASNCIAIPENISGNVRLRPRVSTVEFPSLAWQKWSNAASRRQFKYRFLLPFPSQFPASRTSKKKIWIPQNLLGPLQVGSRLWNLFWQSLFAGHDKWTTSFRTYCNT